MNQFQTFDEVVSALKRRFWLIVLITAIGCALSLSYAISQIKTFEATAVVQIEDARVPDQLAGATAAAENAARRVRLIEQRLMARDNLIRIMDKHDLFADDPAISINERIFQMRQAASIEQIVDASQIYAAGGNTPSGLLITVRLDDPQKAADLANELMYSVIDQSRDRSVSRARDTLDFFVAEEDRVSAEIAVMEEQIAVFKSANSDQLPAGVSDLRDQLASLRDASLDLDQQILTIETTSDRQRDEVKQANIQLLQEQKLLVTERIAQIQAQISGAPEVERALSGMERELNRLQDQYSVITRRKAEAEMGEALENRQQTDRFEVLETALVPEHSVSRSRKKTAIMGAVASLIVGIAVAFATELMNPAIRNAAQMERMLGMQPVVAIPTVSTRHDRTRRGLGILGWIFGLIATVFAATRLFGNGISISDLMGRLLPRAAGS
ncbi:GumC family protein [Pacificoceanicola onchidii]|uniref:GumC family protein n=1 Tax=Pacificoceanicola onchidii TaxID=2562685 RepID=UPI0010A6A69E|nr:Wzz/FepE/Etk N-terminal domain-containing protein [Pacificoceanicola onchidii]